MGRIIAVAAAALIVGGCAITEEQRARLAAQEFAERQAVAQADDAKCQSYGAQPGSHAYISCRMSIDRDRAIVAAAERNGLEAQQQVNNTAMMVYGARMMRGY